MGNREEKVLAERGTEFLGSLMKVLQEDFTPDKAASITSAVMLSVVFHDEIVAYWEESGESVMKAAAALAMERAGGDAPSD